MLCIFINWTPGIEQYNNKRKLYSRHHYSFIIWNFMKILFDEYSDILLTLIGGLIIISIIINSIFSMSIIINHNEDTNKLNFHTEKIGIFECKDVYIETEDYDLLNHVNALSNSNIDIKDKVLTRIIEGSDGKQYVEYILKYCNDFRIIRSKLYIKEDNSDEDNV